MSADAEAELVSLYGVHWRALHTITHTREGTWDKYTCDLCKRYANDGSIVLKILWGTPDVAKHIKSKDHKKNERWLTNKHWQPPPPDYPPPQRMAQEAACPPEDGTGASSSHLPPAQAPPAQAPPPAEVPPTALSQPPAKVPPTTQHVSLSDPLPPTDVEGLGPPRGHRLWQGEFMDWEEFCTRHPPFFCWDTWHDLPGPEEVSDQNLWLYIDSYYMPGPCVKDTH